jgi:Na+/melibiose symporter-like transporter
LGLGGMVLSLLNCAAKERIAPKKIYGHPLQSFKLLLKNKVVLLAMISSMIGGFTLVIGQHQFFQYLITFNIFGWEIDGLASSMIFGIVVGLPSMFGILFTTKFANKLGGMKNILIFIPALAIIFRLIAFAIVPTREAFTSGLGLFVVGFCLMVAGAPGSMRGVAMNTLWGDSLDKIELETGQRNEASVFAMQNLIAKAGWGIGVIFTGWTATLLQYNNQEVDQWIADVMKSVEEGGLGMSRIDAIHYAVEEGVLSATFMTYSYPVFLLAPALGALLSIIPLLFIKHNNAMQKKIEEDLKAMKEKRAAEEEENEALGMKEGNEE